MNNLHQLRRTDLRAIDATPASFLRVVAAIGQLRFKIPERSLIVLVAAVVISFLSSVNPGAAQVSFADVQQLVAKNRFGEANQLLAKHEAEAGKQFPADRQSLDQAFGAYVDKNQPSGQHYLLWFFGIIPLALMACAICAAILLRNSRAARVKQNGGDLSFVLYSAPIVLAFIVSYYAGTIFFYTFSQYFYFREWEYNRYEGFANLIKSEIWKGPVKGELSRKFLFNCQQEEDVVVTLNQFGFRMTPPMDGPPKILFYGDSFAWGMNVSDRDTFPWALSEALRVKVLSGLTTPSNLMNYPRFGENPVFIELYSWARFLNPISPFESVEGFYIPFMKINNFTEAKDRASLIQTHGRYYLPLLVTRSAKRLYGDIQYWLLRNDQDYVFPSAISALVTPQDEIDRLVDKLRERAAQFQRMGFSYLAVPVPERDIFVASEINARTINAHKYFRYKARLAGIHVVDLLQPFGDQDDPMTLYQANDGHWNGKASKLSANVVAKYIQSHNLLQAQSDQLAPEAREPDYAREYRSFIEKHFRPSVPVAARTCTKPFLEFLK